jgi:hypothetical protein
MVSAVGASTYYPIGISDEPSRFKVEGLTFVHLTYARNFWDLDWKKWIEPALVFEPLHDLRDVESGSTWTSSG